MMTECRIHQKTELFQGVVMRRKNLFGKKLSISGGNLRNITMTAILLVVIGSFTLFATSTLAQTGGQGAIQGIVTDASGAVVPLRSTRSSPARIP